MSLRSLLERVKIIEAETPAVPVAPLPDLLPPAAPIAPAPTLTADDALTVPEGVDPDSIYAQAGVPAAAFPIEKLAKLVEGLNQLDAPTKKTAVSAMDAADDSWSIEGVIADGQAKTRALIAYLADLEQLDVEVSAEADRRVAASTEAKKAALATIERQIADLEGQREAAIADSAAEVAQLRAQATAATDAVERERRRLGATIKTYEGLNALFQGGPSPAATPSA